MNVTRQPKSSHNDVILVELTKEDYQSGFEKKLKKYSKEMTVKGFRKGSVPLGMIKKMYGESILAEEINHLADHALNDFVKENSIKLLGRPMLAESQEMLDIQPNEDKSYQIQFEIGYEPSYEIKLTGKTFDKYEINVTPEMVEKELDNVFNYFTKLEDSTEPIADGDTFYFKVSNANGFDSESFATTDELTTLGREQIVGKKTGDILEVLLGDIFDNAKLNIKRYILNLKEDTDMSDEDFAGNYTLEITNVKKKQKPSELTPEQISTITRDEKKNTMEELKIQLEDDIKLQYSNLSTNYLRNDVHEYVVAETEIDLPADFLKRWIVSEKENKLDATAVEKQYSDIEKSIKWDLITSKYALDNQIKVEIDEVREDYRNRYMQYFLQSGYMPQQEQMNKFIDDAMKDQNNVRKTFESILDAKVLDKMIENIAIKPVVYTEEDFVQESKKRNEKKAAHHHDHDHGHDHDHDGHDHQH